MIQSRALQFNEHGLQILDQRQLPHAEEWLAIKSPEDMEMAIKSLAVRGAPLIGVAAALSLGDYSKNAADLDQILEAADKLRASRPTAVNLMWAIDRIKEVATAGGDVLQEAIQIFQEDVQLCERIARYGAEVIESGDNVLTHCNTGGLATAGEGTALAVIKKAFQQGKKIHVYVDETRPLLQGGRLTTWELEKAGVPFTLICDNMAGLLMSKGQVQKVIVGSDRIAANGDFANKIGTYALSVLSFYHRIPFYVAAPKTTVDLTCANGTEIPIEERRPEEVRGVSGHFGETIWAPKSCEVYNPAFDITPAEMVEGWILDTGLFNAKDIKNGKLLGE